MGTRSLTSDKLLEPGLGVSPTFEPSLAPDFYKPTDRLSLGFYSGLRTLLSLRQNEDYDDYKDKDYRPENGHHNELNPF